MLNRIESFKSLLTKCGIRAASIFATISSKPWYQPFSRIAPGFQKRGSKKLVLLLMEAGEIEQAYRLIKAFPSIHMGNILLASRLQEMINVSNSPLTLEKDHHQILLSTTKKPFNNRILFVLHNSLPYDNAGYAIRSHMIAKQVDFQIIQAMTAFAVLLHPGIILKSSPEGEGFNPPRLQTLTR